MRRSRATLSPLLLAAALFLASYPSGNQPAFARPADGSVDDRGGVPARLHWFCKYAFDGLVNARFFLTHRGFQITYELSDLEAKHMQGKKRLIVSLQDLFPGHKPLTKISQRKTARRARRLAKHLPEILERGVLTFEDQRRLLPSQVVMSAVQDRRGNFVLREGNGRIHAIWEALKLHPELDPSDLKVEIVLRDMGGNPEYLDTLDRYLEAEDVPTPERESPPVYEVVTSPSTQENAE